MGNWVEKKKKKRDIHGWERGNYYNYNYNKEGIV